MATPAPSIVWFRQDLRLSDQPALRAAVQAGGPVIAVYIHDPESEGAWAAGGASRWWLHHALKDLGEQLEAIGGALILRQGPSLKVLEALIQETGAQQVFWNRRYEPHHIALDTEIKTVLRNRGLTVESSNGCLLHDPLEIKNLSGQPFQVFTPFWKNCLKNLKFEKPTAAPKKLLALEKKISSVALSKLNLLPTIAWDGGFKKQWQPTRAGAEQRLKPFAKSAVKDYATHRDLPSLDGTSQLSTFLHFGQISPREIIAAIEETGKAEQTGAVKYIAEIGWREFAYHLLYHFPHTPEQPLRAEFAHFPWSPDKKLLKAWQKGRTGYPIVDAGMRQLWHTGWQHNRVRMIAASVLVKHFLQPWQAGAAWFWDTLVDADLAANTLGWQWAGGCGADAAPYFRVFNPVLQGKKFDPEGEYVRRWVPELKNLPSEWIHEPWNAPAEVLAAAGITLDHTYPRPLVGLIEGRDRALEAFEKLRGKK